MRRAVIILAALCTILSFVLAGRMLLKHFSNEPAPESAPAPAIMAEVSAPVSTSDGDLVLDLFNPSENSLNGQLSETALKARLEDTVTLSFILRRCNYLTPATYNDTYHALVLYTQRMEPHLSGEQLQSTITNAVENGSASYALIYSRLRCDVPQLGTANAQLAQWRNAIINPPK